MTLSTARTLCMIESSTCVTQESDDWKYNLIADISAGASKKVVSFLKKLSSLGKQADLTTIVTDQGKTLLMLAVQKSLYEVAARILACVLPEDRETYFNQKDDYGQTAAYYAQIAGHDALVDLLNYYVSAHKNDTLLVLTVARFAAAMDNPPLDTVKEEIIEKIDAES